jgi:membrane protein implicated in regulation of membrane protease activity
MSWLFEQFQNAATSVAFLSVFIGGVLFSAISMFFGGDHGDGHHVGDAGHHHVGEPTLLSIRGAALFFTGLGGVGYLVNTNTGRPVVALLAGIAGGLAFALPMLSFIKFFMRQESSSLIQPEQIIGAEGVVTTSISPNQYGEVRIIVAGSQISKSATSDTPLQTGTPIKVVRHLGGNVFVSPLS